MRETPVEEQIRRLRYLEQKVRSDSDVVALTGPSIANAISRTLGEAAQTMEYLISPPEL